MSAALVVILVLLVVALIASGVRAWRDAQRMNSVFDKRPSAPTEHDAWYITQELRDMTIEQQWRARVAMNERRRAKTKRLRQEPLRDIA